MVTPFIQYFITAFILTWVIPLIGFILSGIERLVYSISCKINPKLAYFICNYLTFIGVIHHELAHALLGFVTGAKIVKINLFKPQGNTLGSVEMYNRGNFFIRSIQMTFTSVAPLICGGLSILLLYTTILPSVSNPLVLILLWYVIVSIALHMTMSLADLKCFVKGSYGVCLLILIVCYIKNFSLLGV